jgi:hypothetical protein
MTPQERLAELEPREAEAWKRLNDFEKSEEYLAMRKKQNEFTNNWLSLHRMTEALKLLSNEP